MVSRPFLVDAVLAIAAVLAIGVALTGLRANTAGLVIETTAVGATPVTVFRRADVTDAPLVLIAHGFAGSQQLMAPFAVSLAQAGYLAATFDFAGHGRNGAPLTGSITDETGATRTLVADLARVAAALAGRSDGRLAVLGHSMASDIVVRFAQETPAVAATIAVSMFSPVVTETSPKNLLVIVGDWEGGLKDEALRVAGLVSAPAPPRAGETYGEPAAGTGRRVVFAPTTEHVSVLYSTVAAAEAIAWLDRTFGLGERVPPPRLDDRGPKLLLLFAGIAALARPLARLLPAASAAPQGAGLARGRLAVVVLAPLVLTPPLLTVIPTTFLPVLVGDYLAVHFLAYGLLTLAALLVVGGGRRPEPARAGALVLATLAAIGFGVVAIVWPLDAFVTSFVPTPARLPLVAVLLVGTLAFFGALEWAARGPGVSHWAYAAAKLAFLVSLAAAVALDFERLFFLVIIVPVIALWFVIYGLFSGWIYAATRHPLPGAVANAVAFAWAIGVVFPLLGR